MKHLQKFEAQTGSLLTPINTNVNGLLKVYKEEAESEMKELFIQKIKKCFEEEYDFTFESLKDEEYFGTKFRSCLINNIPMKIKEDTGSYTYIKFNLDALVRANMTDIVQIVTEGKKTSGPEFESVLEVVVYFQKNSISIKSNPNLSPLIKTGLFDK